MLKQRSNCEWAGRLNHVTRALVVKAQHAMTVLVDGINRCPGDAGRCYKLIKTTQFEIRFLKYFVNVVNLFSKIANTLSFNSFNSFFSLWR